MSDADILREAADRLDKWASFAARSAPEHIQRLAVQRRAEAALLRAMADDLEIGLYIVGAESPAAALALADTFLGMTESSRHQDTP